MAANLGVKARGGPGLHNVAYLWECVRGDTYGIWIPTAWIVDSSYKKTERSGELGEDLEDEVLTARRRSVPPLPSIKTTPSRALTKSRGRRR